MLSPHRNLNQENLEGLLTKYNMCSPASSKILYRNPRFLRVAFLQLHHQQQSGVFCDALLQAEGKKVTAVELNNHYRTNKVK